jgi:hypothetical protein
VPFSGAVCASSRRMLFICIGAAGDLFKWIDDLYAFDHLAVIHVFG